MEINSAALQPNFIQNSPRQKNDSFTEIQILEQQKQNIKRQLNQLLQSKQGGDTLKSKKEDLLNQIKKIDQKIQALKKEKGAEAQSVQEVSKVRPPRFDEYVKNDRDNLSM